MKASYIIGTGGALAGLAALLLLTPACSVVGVRKTPEPDYTVVKVDEDIEVRRYEPMILAQTSVEDSDLDGSSDVAFRRLFNYITGANTSADKISMTAPVLQEKSSEKIAMTAPVLQEKSEQNTWNMAFVLPSSFTMETAPRPTNDKVKLVQRDARHVATLRFSGRRSEALYQEQAATLTSWLRAQGYELLSAPRFAGYDPPYTLPMMRRNEVLIDVKMPSAS